MLVKIHKSYRNVVAICDTDLIGKKFEEGIKLLDVTENFYSGEEQTEKEMIEIMKSYASEDATFNIVGKESTQTALKAGIITEEGIKTVAGIPFALILL